MTQTIETAIPMPDDANTWVKKLDALPVGGSFSFPSDKVNSMNTTIWKKFHRTGASVKRFKTSTVNQPEGMARVWRKEDESDAD